MIASFSSKARLIAAIFLDFCAPASKTLSRVLYLSISLPTAALIPVLTDVQISRNFSNASPHFSAQDIGPSFSVAGSGPTGSALPPLSTFQKFTRPGNISAILVMTLSPIELKLSTIPVNMLDMPPPSSPSPIPKAAIISATLVLIASAGEAPSSPLNQSMGLVRAAAYRARADSSCVPTWFNLACS